MIRISGGRLRGRRLRVAAGIRPTTESTRKAAFDILSERVIGARILDAAAGSGAFGLEGLSRGAAHATFVESDAAVARVLCENIAACGAGEDAQVHVMELGRFLRKGSPQPFDVIYHDPPYDHPSEEDLEALRDVLAPGGLLLHESRRAPDPKGTLRPDSVRHYGSTWLWFFES